MHEFAEVELKSNINWLWQGTLECIKTNEDSARQGNFRLEGELKEWVTNAAPCKEKNTITLKGYSWLEVELHFQKNSTCICDMEA